MKAALLLSLLFLSNISPGQVTYTFNNEFTYKPTHKPDTSDRTRVNEQYTELLVGDTVSLFRSVKFGFADSVKKQHHHRRGTPLHKYNLKRNSNRIELHH